MAAYNKFNAFTENVAEGFHDFANDALKVALCATANAPVATNSVLADLTQISYTNLTGLTLTSVTSVGAGGVLTVDAANITIAASGGAGAAFQYIVIYNEDTVTPTDALICWFDYGSALTLADGESLVITLDAAGLFTIT